MSKGSLIPILIHLFRHNILNISELVGTLIYLHRMADETEGGHVSRTGVLGASAVQQSIKHPSLLTGPVAGPTAEERMGAVVDPESRHQNTIQLFLPRSILLLTEQLVIF